MKGDFTRLTFRPKRHYSSVRMQQGRVQLDADWNEQVDIAAHRVETETIDVVGSCGAPQDHGGFELTSGALPQITAGRFYVDGILVENEQTIDLDKQPDQPGFVLKKNAGDYLAYLDVWQRHVTVLEDDLIREVALNGPDSTTRTQTIWQVQLIGPLPAGQTCLSEPDDWKKLLGVVPGRLRARSAPGALPSNLCDIPASGGYRRLENQLYRVEIHTGGARGVATFKWSRDNGSIVTHWDSQEGNDLIVQNPGRDDVLGFAPGQTVELTDDDRELRGEVGVLVKLGNVEGQVLSLDATYLTAHGLTIDRSTFGNNPKIRRWDSDGEIKTSAAFTALEDGVEVMFEPGDYQPGDYWTIPARTAKADVEWPRDPANANLPAAVERQGITHHYCKLAILHSDGTTFTVSDCRPLFPPLTALTRFFYVGGDGQETIPGQALALPLQVGVMNGSKPVSGVSVHFAGTGTLDATDPSLLVARAGPGDIIVATGATGANDVAKGVASCAWTPDPTGADFQHVVATRLDAANNATTDPPITFNANLSVARQVAYTPGQCADLANAHTVQEALDILCNLPRGGGSCCCITVGPEGDFKELTLAIETTLFEKHMQNVCICILPGEQAPVGRIDINPDQIGNGVHLEIKGCAGVQLLLRELWSIQGLASFQLRDLTLILPEFELPDAFISLVQCGHIVFENTVCTGLSDTGTLLRIAQAGDITLRDNRLQLQPGKNGRRPQRIFANTLLSPIFAAGPGSTKAASLNMIAARVAQLLPPERDAMLGQIKHELDAAAPDMSPPEQQAYARLLDTLAANQVNAATLAAFVAALQSLAAANGKSGAALELDDAQADTVLDSNIILGPVVLYGPMPGIPNLDEMKNLLHILMKLNNGDLGNSVGVAHLHMAGNELTQVLISTLVLRDPEALIKENGVFQGAYVSDNDFDEAANEWLAYSAGLSGNTFLSRGTNIAAVVIGDTTSVTGNRAAQPESLILVGGTLEAAANARIVVQAF